MEKFNPAIEYSCLKQQANHLFSALKAKEHACEYYRNENEKLLLKIAELEQKVL